MLILILSIFLKNITKMKKGKKINLYLDFLLTVQILQISIKKYFFFWKNV